MILRLVPVILTRHIAIGLDDMFQYDMLARSLAAGNGFRWYAPADLAKIAPYLHLDPSRMALDPRGMLTTFRAPLYPAFLALVYAVNGINDGRFVAARLAQAVLGATLAPLTYFTARRLLAAGGAQADELPHSERAARLAAGVVAAYPMLLIFPFALATESLFFLLVLASFFALLTLQDTASPSSAIIRPAIAGLLLGLAALTRSVILPFAGLAILWVWFSLKQRRSAIIAALVMLATVLPWVVRNSLLSGKPTGIETSMGYNLYVGYHPQSTGTFTFGPSLDLMSILDDAQRDHQGTQQALAFIRAEPQRFPYLAARRLGYFFNLELRAFTYFYVNNFLGYIPFAAMLLTLLVLALPFVILSLSASLGWSLLPRTPATLLLLLLFIAYLLPHVFILSEERFHLTLIPFFAITAAAFWVRGISGLRTRGLWAVLAGAVIVLLLVANWSFELGRDWHTIVAMLGPGGNQIYLPY